MENWKRRLAMVLGNQFGKTVGTAAGIVVGVLYLMFGFWKTLIFAVIVFLGFYIGSHMDRNEDWRDIVDRVVPERFRDS